MMRFIEGRVVWKDMKRKNTKKCQKTQRVKLGPVERRSYGRARIAPSRKPLARESDYRRWEQACFG